MGKPTQQSIEIPRLKGGGIQPRIAVHPATVTRFGGEAMWFLLTRQANYQGVHLRGQRAWDANAALKASGEKRVLKRFPDDPVVSWEEWKKRPDVFA